MFIFRMICNKLVFKSACSVMAGAAIVTMFAFLLTMYGASKETKITKVAQQEIEFPQNEQMLDKMAMQLAGEAEELSKIAPASGDIEKKFAAHEDVEYKITVLP